MKHSVWLIIVLVMILSGCGRKIVSRQMEVTAYCGCGYCCGWERGSWKFLKLNFWNKYNKKGKNRAKQYSGRTANNTKPHEPVPGLFSMDSICKPWMIPVRILLFPWLLIPRDGTIAADTKYYSFGTRVYIPGYGYGIVEDRGSAIKGKKRFDVFFRSHQKALEWGRKKVHVRIEK